MPTPTDDLLRKLEPILKDKTKAYWFFNLLNDDSKSSDVLNAILFKIKELTKSTTPKTNKAVETKI